MLTSSPWIALGLYAKTADRTAKQERSRETRRKLVASCLELVDHRPFDQVTVADIAKGAGMSVGNFYRRFTGKEGILPDLYAAYEERFAAFAQAFSQREPIETDNIRGRWEFLIGRTLVFMEDNRGLIQALHLHGRLHPEIVPPTSHDRRRSLFARASELFSSADEARAQTMGRVAILVLVSTLTEQIIYPDHAPAAASDVSTADLVDELGRMLAAYAAAPPG
jgi:AcrR family transcriptional regulator